jgi:TrwC relaxase
MFFRRNTQRFTRWPTSTRDLQDLHHSKGHGLRVDLARRLGVEWRPVRNGIADLVGIPQPTLDAFSVRRAEIEEEMDRRGV